MTNPTTKTVTVGLDVHAASIRIAAIRADELVDERTLPYDEEAIAQTLARWPGARCCYEAGPTGFGLYRYLRERGIACDARKLARLHDGGLLEPIHVPSPQEEAARDLVRVREDARIGRLRDRHRLGKFLLRNGRRMPGGSWGSRDASGSPTSASPTPPSSRRSPPTCTLSTSSMSGSKPSSARSPRSLRAGPGASSSPACAACAGSTP